MKVYFAIVGVASMLVGTRALGQQAEEARGLLAESAKALQSAGSVTFHGKQYATGMLKELVDCEGDVKVWREKPDGAPMVMITARIKQPGEADRQVKYVQDATLAQWLDERANSIRERPIGDTLARHEFDLARHVMPDEFISGRLYEAVMKSPKLVSLPDADVGGERCKVVQGESGNRTITWWISAVDKLPRRSDMTTSQGAVQLSMILDISRVDTTTRLTMADFGLPIPAGAAFDVVGRAARPPAAESSIQLGLDVGVEAPRFSLPDSGGNDVQLSAARGSVVVLEFFGSIFKSCIAGSAGMQGLVEDYKGKNIAFIAMACREPSETSARDYFKTNGLTYTLVPKADAAVADYKVVGFPSYYVITPDGKVAAFYQNFPGKDVMASAINNAMQSK